MGVPNATGRLEILHIHTRNMTLSDDVDLQVLNCIREPLEFIDAEILHAMSVQQYHFDDAMNTVPVSDVK